MSAIIDGCVDILKVVNDTRTPEQIFDDYVKDKMMKVYYSEDSEYNSLLSKLEANINSLEYNQVKVCITKILRLLNRNRQVLIHNLERLG